MNLGGGHNSICNRGQIEVFLKNSFGTLHSHFLINGINPSSEEPLNIDAICCPAACYHGSPLNSGFLTSRRRGCIQLRGGWPSVWIPACERPGTTPQSCQAPGLPRWWEEAKFPRFCEFCVVRPLCNVHWLRKWGSSSFLQVLSMSTKWRWKIARVKKSVPPSRAQGLPPALVDGIFTVIKGNTHVEVPELPSNVVC